MLQKEKVLWGNEKLSKTAKLENFSNLKLGKDNRPFWEKWKAYFTKMHSIVDTDIMLNENGKLLLKDKDIADTFNEYFWSIVESLDLYKWESEVIDLGLNDSNQDYLDIIRLNRILDFLKSFHLSLSPRMRSKR